jgi:hypothetical protein
MRSAAPKLVISAAAVALLLAQLFAERFRFKIEPVTLGLAALAVLPWLSSIIDSAKLPGGWEVKFRDVQVEQAKQRKDLDDILKFLWENFVTEYELVHLEKVRAGLPFPFNRTDSFEKELRRLLSLGLLERKPDRGMRTLFEAGDDVRNHLQITERGRDYLRRRSMFAQAAE